MAFFQRWFSRYDKARESGKTGDQDSSDVSLRRRNFANLVPAKGESLAPEPEKTHEQQALKAEALKVEKKRSVTKKPTVAKPAVMESISVVLRRQIPIRFNEEASSWIGGLPKMPVGMEWPHAKPKKPLHFVAQINCADLPRELWGGLGPRDGWLLLFADIEALTDQIKRPFARVIHVTELGPEVQPPTGLYWARNNLGDVSRLKGTLPGVQRRHFRQWPIDLVKAAADTSELTGSELYGAPENDRSLGAPDSIAIDRPMTWRGAYTILAGLVKGLSAEGYERNWAGNGGMLDYPEPTLSDFNERYFERRPDVEQADFHEACERLTAQMYEERRKGWMHRASQILDEQLALAIGGLADRRAKFAEAQAHGDIGEIRIAEQLIASAQESVAKHSDNRAYLENLFAQYASEDDLVAEINRVGRAHLEWAQRTLDQLRALLDEAGKMDLDAPIKPAEWDDIAAKIASMKTVYWQKTYDTDLLRKVEHGVHYNISNAVREEVLDVYTSPPSSADELGPDIIANLEPRLRHLEADRPHKLGGLIDSVYDDPLRTDHILLFQIASDGATGWIMGDLGLLYVSIHRSDLEAGSFDNVKAWLEA
jgi:uncharacterized protein YwqG